MRNPYNYNLILFLTSKDLYTLLTKLSPNFYKFINNISEKKVSKIFGKIKENKAITGFIILTALMIFSMGMSSGFQNSFGQVDVQIVNFKGLDGENLVAKIYRPSSATSSDPAPGILAIHGFNNDKDVYRPSAIELARAGMVVLCIDQNGHGASDGSFQENWDNPADSSYFAAYQYLATNLSYVDAANLGVMGHSMGSLEINYMLEPILFAYGGFGLHAVVLETFSPGYWLNSMINTTLCPNLLHIMAEKEEFEREEDTTLSEWITSALQVIDAAYGLTGTAAFDTTYDLGGGWASGAMRRHALIPTTHPGLTASPQAIAEKVAWFSQALLGKTVVEAWDIANPVSQIFIYSEIFGILACLFALMSILPLAVLLMKIKFLKDVNQPIPEKTHVKKKYIWYIFASINAIIGVITFLTFTYWRPEIWGGTGKIESITNDFFNIGIANSLAIWYLINTGISAVLFGIWYALKWRKDRSEISFHDMGVSFARRSEKEGLSFKQRFLKSANFKILGKTILIAAILFGWLYLWVFLADLIFKIPLRGVWSILTTLTFERFLKFLGYFVPTLLFFLVVGGLFLFGELKLDEKESSNKTQAIWWLKACFAMLAGLVVLVLIQYGPMWFGQAPPLNTPELTEDWGPLMTLLLMGLIPIYATIIFMLIYFYRKTGKIYLGAIMASLIVTWINVTSFVMYI